MTVNLADAAGEITQIALKNIEATRTATDALARIASLERSCPLAAEIALGALRDMKAQVVK